MQRNNTYDIAKCWAIVSVIVYHVINIIFYNQIIHSFIDTYFLALFFFISGLLVKDDKVKCKGWLKMKAVQLLIPFICIFIFNRLYYHFLEGSSIWSQKSIDDSKSGFWFIFSLFCFLLTTKFCTYFSYHLLLQTNGSYSCLLIYKREIINFFHLYINKKYK